MALFEHATFTHTGHVGPVADVPSDMAVPGTYLQLCRHHQANAGGGCKILKGKTPTSCARVWQGQQYGRVMTHVAILIIKYICVRNIFNLRILKNNYAYGSRCAAWTVCPSAITRSIWLCLQRVAVPSYVLIQSFQK